MRAGEDLFPLLWRYATQLKGHLVQQLKVFITAAFRQCNGATVNGVLMSATAYEDLIGGVLIRQPAEAVAAVEGEPGDCSARAASELLNFYWNLVKLATTMINLGNTEAESWP